MSFDEGHATTLHANGIAHHVVTFGPEDAPAERTVVLCHGFLDQAYSFAPVAAHLAEAGYRSVAFDWRGHGRSSWVGEGGYYHFPDYVADLAALLPQVAPGAPHLVGHSMGGTATSMFAGVRPKAILTLTLVEGTGPPNMPIVGLADRFETWLSGMARAAPRREKPKVMADLDEALERMRKTHGQLPEALGRFLAEKATRAVEGGRAWCFDPYHRTRSPLPFRLDAYEEIIGRIEVPVQLVLGSRGFRYGDEDARAELFGVAAPAIVEDAGHMIHWDAPEALAGLIVAHAEAPR